ncbi:MAG: hypothetical protein ACLR8Y_12000 [Alistipes indistinctus]
MMRPAVKWTDAADGDQSGGIGAVQFYRACVPGLFVSLVPERHW